MEAAAGNHKQVPYGMAVRQMLPQIEDNADRESDTTCNQQREPHWRQYLMCPGSEVQLL